MTDRIEKQNSRKKSAAKAAVAINGLTLPRLAM